MRIAKWMVLIAVLACFVAGCGPGQPFEIEGRCSPQSITVAQAAVDAQPSAAALPVRL